MIIWSGFGFLPVLFLVVFGFGIFAGYGKSAGDTALILTLILTGLASGALGWWLRKKPARIVIDKKTGREIALKQSHSLFFIPMIYWGPIFIGLGLFIWIQDMMKH
jgi:hypothetical protein